MCIRDRYYTTKPDSIGIFLPSYIYGKHWKKSSFYPYINPENKEIIRNLPPSFLVTAYGDTLRNYSRQYAKAIKRAGVICHLEDYEVDKKLPHAFSTTFPEMEESKRANTQMVEFLFKYWWNARKPYWSPDPDYSPCTRMQSLYTVKNTIFLKS